MARGMVEVELVGDEPPRAPQHDPAAERRHRVRAALARAGRWTGGFVVRRWRIPWLRWTTLAVIAALVAVPVADAARERTRLAEPAPFPGAMRPLRPDLHVLFRVESPDSEGLQEGFLVDGAVVSAHVPQAGGSAIVAVDAGTGARRWAIELSPVRSASDAPGFPWCGPAADVVACVASSDAGTSVWVLDAADGRLLRSEAYDEHVQAVVTGGLLVVAEQVSGPARAPVSGPWVVSWRVTGEDPATGEARWTWTAPAVAVTAEAEEQNLAHDPTDYGSWLTALGAAPVAGPGTGADLALRVGDDTWVLTSGGALRTHVTAPGGWWLSENRGALVRTPLPVDPSGRQPAPDLLADDGTWHRVDGGPLWTLADDGSAPDVALVVAGEDSSPVLTGVDRRTGASLWRLPLVTGGVSVAGVVLDGTVYVSTPADLRAVDLAAGTTRWAVPTAAGDLGTSWMTTDGSVLLRVVVDQSGFADTAEALSLADGRTLWLADLRAAAFPDGAAGNLSGIGSLTALGRIGLSRADGSVIVLG